MKKLLLAASVTAAATIILSSCGGNNLFDDDSGTRGPADAAAFAGSVVTFNPTLTFSANGVVEYSNEATSPYFGTAFPETPAGTSETGTFDYLAGQEFQTGTLTLSFPTLDGGYIANIPVTNFVTVDGLVQSFTLNFPQEGPFEATVRSGTIEAANAPSGPGTGNNFVFGPDGNIVGGTTFSKANISTFYSGVFGGGSLTYSPLPAHSIGELVTFAIAANGNFQMDGIDRRFGTGPYTLSVPFVGNQNGVLTYRGVDSQSGGTIVVTFDYDNTNLLTVRWSDNTFSDYEQQSFE